MTQAPLGIDLGGGSFIAAKLDISGKELAERAAAGNERVLSAIREGGNALGLAVATLVNTLNPEQLVFGGGTILLPGYYESMIETTEKYSIPEMWEVCTLPKVKSGGCVAALGAVRKLEDDRK